jgi:hypothetical protein
MIGEKVKEDSAIFVIYESGAGRQRRPRGGVRGKTEVIGSTGEDLPVFGRSPPRLRQTGVGPERASGEAQLLIEVGRKKDAAGEIVD